MRALIYDPYWDSLGGGERYAASVAAVLLAHGWSVDIPWSTDLSRAITDRFGLDISKASFIPANPSPKYQVVFWVSDGSLPTSFARKTIIHLQFPFQNIGGRSVVNSLKSKLYQFVVNSRFTKSYIDREFGVESRVIYPPIDTAKFVPGPKENILLYVGRFSNLTQAKGQHHLIESFSRLHPKLPGWKLVLIGGIDVGTENDYMASLRSQSAGLPVQIITSPNLSILQNYFAQAKIFWSAVGLGIDPATSPLKVEHFGISVVEAMSAGVVPIVPAAGGYPEIVDDGQSGYLYTALPQLEQLTLDLVANPDLLASLSSAAVKKSKIFDITRFNTEIMQLV